MSASVGVLQQNIDRIVRGWRMVPREPTPEMIKAAVPVLISMCRNDNTLPAVCDAVYRVMFDAFQNTAT